MAHKYNLLAGTWFNGYKVLSQLFLLANIFRSIQRLQCSISCHPDWAVNISPLVIVEGDILKSKNRCSA